MTDAEIAELIDGVLRRHLARSGLKRFTVTAGTDHDGDQALFLDLYFEGRGRKVDAEALMSAVTEARRRIEAHGDLRFPYPRLHVPDAKTDEAA